MLINPKELLLKNIVNISILTYCLIANIFTLGTFWWRIADAAQMLLITGSA